MTQFAWKWQLGKRPLHDFTQVKPTSVALISSFPVHVSASCDCPGCRLDVGGVLAGGLSSVSRPTDTGELIGFMDTPENFDIWPPRPQPGEHFISMWMIDSETVGRVLHGVFVHAVISQRLTAAEGLHRMY